MTHFRFCIKLLIILVGVGLIGDTGAIAQTARIYSITGGKVQIRRDRRKDWSSAGKGTELNEGDQIRPEKDARVVVACPPNSRKERVAAGVPSAIGGNICAGLVIRDDRGTQSAETLGGADPTIPYLIAPRHALVLNDKPLLRWNQAAGATQYNVEVAGSTGTVWQTQTKNTQIIYAGKPLEPGAAYTVTITTNTGKSSQNDRLPNRPQQATQLDFRILRPQEGTQIKQSARKIAPTVPVDEADALLLARLYADYTIPEAKIQTYNLSSANYTTYSLTNDAIALLESLIQQRKTSPLIYRTLGELYWQIGLVNLAVENYQKAIDLVQSPEDLEDWTLAHHNLGQVYFLLGNSRQTLDHYRQARAGYSFLGDTVMAEDLQNRINKLEK
jgi:type VI protein secretion system component Hcp